jgi:coenzyme F420-reducing hydrogenase beta subunit
MCGAVCPTQAISIKLNKDGFYRPVVDDEKCVNCGLCVKSCYKFDDEIKVTRNPDSYSLYAAWAKDSQIVANTTSGGVADLLARQLIREGYKCIGVKYDTNTNCALGEIAATEDETLVFRGSKYIQSLSVDAFKALVKNVKTEKFAVFGLPCQIYAISRFLSNRGLRDQHVLIDLYCHGCPSLNVWKKYISDIEKKHEDWKVGSVNFRSKLRGWGNYCLDINLSKNNDSKQIISSKINDPFFELFFSDYVLNDSCYACKIRSTFEYVDIRLGDFWGKKYLNNKTGVSGVTLCSSNAQGLFDAIKDNLDTSPQPLSSLLSFQSYGKEYSCNSSLREKMLSQLADDSVSLKTTLKTYKSALPFPRRLKLEAKNIIKLMPQGVITAAKKLVQ